MPGKFLLALILAIALLLVSCWEQPGKPASKDAPQKDILAHAHAFYRQHKFQQSLAMFSNCLSVKAGHPDDKSRRQEAALGMAICRLLTANDQWPTSMGKWTIGSRGYWQGQTFTVLEGLAPSVRLHFEKKLAATGHDCGLWLLLRLALRHRHYPILPRIIARIEEGELAWRYCLAFGWSLLKDNSYSAASLLFDSLLRTSASGKTCHEEARYGLVVARILENGQKQQIISLPRGWRYRLDLSAIDFFRPGSPMHEYQENLTRLPFPVVAELVLADSLYILGGKAKNKIDVWERGDRYLEAAECPATLTAIYSCCRTRFRLAMAWRYLITGSRENARRIFTGCLKAGNIERQWQWEARLGLALLAFKQDQELEAASALLAGWQPGRHYWLGGKKFDFYRLSGRARRREAIERMCDDGKHRIYLTMLDALCLLGDGRTAQTMLGNIVAASGDSTTKEIYLAEEVNIPIDAYAENQIWEKPD